MKCVSAIDLPAKVSHLPETDQPIDGHLELSGGASRPCDDRLAHITTIYHALEKALGRPLKVLDLGCAQGFFSMSLAALGAHVLGVDFLPQNVDVCRALAAAHPEYTTQFIEGRVEDLLATLEKGQFDLVLGLSVFHHITYQYGVDKTTALLSALADRVGAGIFEMALKEEPLSGGPSQPANPKEHLSGFAFVHSVAQIPTYLSSLQRPLIFASNTLWYLDGLAGIFDQWQNESHPFTNGVHQGTRRYFFSNDLIVKHYSLEHHDLKSANISEHDNEVAFLSSPLASDHYPKMILQGKNDTELWIAREKISGDSLIERMSHAQDFDPNSVALDILKSLVLLETSGFYHNDVRPWNVIIGPNNRAVLIDYGAVSKTPKDCQWPHHLLLSFLIFIREVFERKISNPAPVRDAWFELHGLPQEWQIAFQNVFTLPTPSWTFARLMGSLLEQTGPCDVAGAPLGSYQTLFAVSESLSSIYRNHVHHLNHLLNDAHSHRMRLEEAQEKSNWTMKNLEMGLRRTSAQLESQEKNVRWFKQQWLASDQSREALRAEYDALLLRVHHLDHHIAQIYSSNSWRITRPLRRFLAFVRDYRASFIKHIKIALKKPCVRCVAFSVKYPLIRRVALQILKIAPNLKLRLRNIAAGAGLLPQSPEAPLPEVRCYPPTYSSIVYRKIMNANKAEGVDANRH